MNEEITKMSLLITHLDVSTETKEKLYTQNYKISTEIERLNNIIDKANNILKDTNVDMPETLLIETIDYARHILNGGYEE